MIYVWLYTATLTLLLTGFWTTGWAILGRQANTLGQLKQLARLTVGLGFWTASLFTLAACGQLHLPGLVLPLLLLAGLTFWRGPRWGGPRWARPACTTWRDPAHWVPAGLLAVFLLPSYLLTLTPQIGWDDGVYHLTLPKLWLAAAGFRPVEFSVYSHWPLNTELLFALAMLVSGPLVSGPVLAKLLHFGFGLAGLSALFASGLIHPLSRWLAIGLFLANGVVAFELRVAYVDLAAAFYLLAAFLFLEAAITSSADADRAATTTHLLLAGLAAGLLAGTKVTGVLGVVAVAALYPADLVREKLGSQTGLGHERPGHERPGHERPALPVRKFLLCFVLPVLVLWTPWLLRTALFTGNPVYPLGYARWGGPDWSSELAHQFQTWQNGIGMGRGLLDYLLLPLRVILAGGPGYHRFDGELGKFWLVVLPATLFAWRQPRVRRALGVAALYFGFWALSSQQMRFLIPLLPLLALAAATAFDTWLQGLSSRARWVVCAVAFALLTVFLIQIYARPLGSGWKLLRVYGQVDPAQLKASATPPVFRFINEVLPADARVLFLNTNQTFHCDRDFLADSFFEASQIADWLRPATTVAELQQRLRARRITHILYENRDWGIAYPAALQQLLNDSRAAEVLFRADNGQFVLFALRG